MYRNATDVHSAAEEQELFRQSVTVAKASHSEKLCEMIKVLLQKTREAPNAINTRNASKLQILKLSKHTSENIEARKAWEEEKERYYLQYDAIWEMWDNKKQQTDHS